MVERKNGLTRRGALLGAGAALSAAPGWVNYVQAQSAEPIRIGFQAHRTGVGATYGRWYERVTIAATRLINEQGGMNGRPVEIITEDDGTDPRRGAELIEKFAAQHNVDLAYGPLFSNVVMGSAPRAGELKLPYFVVSEGDHVASGRLNRWTLQPGITNVKSQVRAITPWFADTLGKRVAMIFADYAFGHDHRDFFSAAIAEQGGEVVAKIAIPPTETSFTRYFPRIPRDVDAIYHVMVGPSVLTFVREMGRFFGNRRPAVFGFVDSLEGVDIATPGLEFLEGTWFWEGWPRYQGPLSGPHDAYFRDQVGLTPEGASRDNPDEVSTYSHMFACWETLFFIKRAMELCDYRGRQDRQALIEAAESIDLLPLSPQHPQGAKVFNGRTHQSFGRQFISRVEGGRLVAQHVAPMEQSFYPDEVDYTQMSF